jgi:hypothetical protein
MPRRVLRLFAWLLIAACAAPPAAAQAGCTFALGFEALREQIPDVVGGCLDDERFDPESGNAEQRTTGGLLVWRKADNWTAFTDGATTWINGPNGLASRPNAGPLFPWESGRSFAAIAGGWWHHGFGLDVSEDGRAQAVWRTYQWCGPGVVGACDRMQGDQIISGGEAEIVFTGVEPPTAPADVTVPDIAGRPVRLGMTQTVTATGRVQSSTDEYTLPVGPVALAVLGYGLAQLRRDRLPPVLLCSFRDMPDTIRAANPCGA